MIRINKTAILLACIMSFLSTHSVADVVVIVNPNSSVSEIDDTWLGAIFLGKRKDFPDGSSAVPVEQKPGTSARDEFNEKIINKEEAELRAYWAQQIFSGKGQPNTIVSGDADVKKLVSENPAMIGYIDASKVDETVKVILKLE